MVLHIDTDSLLGHDDLAAYLVGHGYITAHAGRDLARQCDSLDLLIRTQTRPPPTDHDPGPPGPSGPGPGGPDPGGRGSGDRDDHADPGGEDEGGEDPGGEDPCVDPGGFVPGGHVHDPHHHEYRPRRALTRRIIARNPHCRAPGCTRPATQCDLDHCLEWPHGITCDCNLLPLCRTHHNLKTTGHWRYTMHPDGSLTWTTRLNRQYRQPPPEPVGH